MVALEALFSDLLIALTQSTGFRWGLAAAVSLWIWLIGRSATPWRVAALLAPFLAAAILEGLDQFVVGPGSGAQSGWLYFYLQSQVAFSRLLSVDGALLLLLAVVFGFLHRFSLAILLCLATALYLRYAIYGASEVLLSGVVGRWLLVVLPTVLIVILGLYSLGATLRLIVAVRQARNGDDDDRF
jgi:hypothetical protein